MAFANGNLRINDDGTGDVIVDPDGLPAMECIVPCPFGSIEDREEEARRNIEIIHCQGYVVTGQTMMRNEAFDRKGAKTTTRINYRACKTIEEAGFVLGQVKKMIDAEVT